MATVKLNVRLTDVTDAPIEKISTVVVKTPKFRAGDGVTLITSQPKDIPLPPTAEFTIDVVEGLGYLYIEGNGWSDSIRFVAKAGMTSFMEAVINAQPDATRTLEYWRVIDDIVANLHDQVSQFTDTTNIVGYIDNTHSGKVVRLDEDGKLFISTASITDPGNPVNKAYVDSMLSVSEMKRGQIPRWDGTKFVGSWADMYADLNSTTY